MRKGPGEDIARVARRGILAVGVLASVAPAQRQFDEMIKRHLPPDGDPTWAIDVGDIDGDGDLDLIFGNFGPQTRLYRNDGGGHFVDLTSSHLPSDGEATSDVCFADVDGDGDLDAALASRFGRLNRLYRNDGTGTFVDATTQLPPDGGETTAVAAGDVDGDGDVDLIFGNHGEQNRLYLNDGSGSFTDGTATRLPAFDDETWALAVGDVDGDRDLDLVVGNWCCRDPNRLYLNDGTGTFVDVTGTFFPAEFQATLSLALADVDGDADLDLIAGNDRDADVLYLNDGTGTYINGTAGRLVTSTETSEALALGDVDRDGDLDLFIGREWQGQLLLNDGAGSFTDATVGRVPSQPHRTRDATLADLDGDGDLDLLLGNNNSFGQQNQLWLNNGLGSYMPTVLPPIEFGRGGAKSIAHGDVDGDGDADLLLGNNLQDQLWLNDGFGSFVDDTAARLPLDADGTTAVTLVDFDGDGDFDLVAGNDRSQNRFYENDGTGVFVDETLLRVPPDNDPTQAIDTGDVDGDGDIDVLIANASAQNRLYLNVGNGTFVDGTGRLPIEQDDSAGVALGDVDGDGDLDAVFANRSRQKNRLYRNDGAGGFTEDTSGIPADAMATSALALADVDCDGDLDLVFANRLQKNNQLYLNDGRGVFTDVTATQMPRDRRRSDAVAVADVDGDRDPDLVFGNGAGQPNLLYLNDGAGHFVDASSRILAIRDWTAAVHLADLDGDADADLLCANSIQNRLYFNLLRHVHTPHLVQVGNEYRLDVYARYAPPQAFGLALPYVAASTARYAIPRLGTFGLDPSQALALPALDVTNGFASVRAAMPRSPSLIGASIHAQALMLAWPPSASLTGVTADAIRP
ncbi:MAG: VCBS repeat-containing protein [Planctomycetota bacterium]